MTTSVGSEPDENFGDVLLEQMFELWIKQNGLDEASRWTAAPSASSLSSWARQDNAQS
ncbi:MAG: hypothetical protein H0T91_03395 [Propionibacteriaceae bacterium]|nr:hypothetical protein [Propionibacteriaceae bacterium]